ncbi:MAG: T9SS type A sorting domain-containing protein [Dysgonamonadaceae bacterium]|jgi:hypothetical protein|nr:T9SS type A sorting domain-containing protein [Dysgonamonadaceae bacterium]
MKRIILLLVFMMSICSILFAKTTEGAWPPAEDYNIIEWVQNMGDYAIAYDQIVYYQGGFYQCVREDGMHSWGEEWWNPEYWTVEHTDANNVVIPKGYDKIAEGKLWVENIGTLELGMNYIYHGVVYVCISAVDSWGEEYFNPETGNPAAYSKVCNITLAEKEPEPENILPDNYVGYWYDNELRWLPGWIAINIDTHLIYKCIAKTNANGGEFPGSKFGHWWNENGIWNEDPTPLGEEKDLLSIEGVTIPTWDDLRSWPKGAIVVLEGKYYTCIANTHKEGNEIPGAQGSEWGFWTDLNLYTGITSIAANSLKYAVENGCLYLYDAVNPSIQLYNVSGQLLNRSYSNSIVIPQHGVYVVKVVSNGKTSIIKVLR